jgi:SAM-dependent methyltransferase
MPPEHERVRALSDAELETVRRSRRHPNVGQFDYLHLRYLNRDLARAIAGLASPVRDVLDVWCGSRPYEDLLPASARCIGIDVEDNPYGVADVVSNDLLPFEDESFDLVTCIEAFQFVRDPVHAIREFRRVLRPGGTALVTLPFAFEYGLESFECRYTEHELRALFDGWDQVDVGVNGGRIVAWTVLTGSVLAATEQRVGRRRSLRLLLRPMFLAGYTLLNGVGFLLATVEERKAARAVAFPMNLLLTARRPVDA